MLELYNRSRYTAKVPRYRYNGQYVIKPGESQVIEDDQAPFFRPYSRIGVIIRRSNATINEDGAYENKSTAESIKNHSEDTTETQSHNVAAASESEDIQSVNATEGSSEEPKDDNSEDTSSNEGSGGEQSGNNTQENESLKYTLDYLNGLERDALMEIATKFGIEVKSNSRRDIVAKKIIEVQESSEG